MPNLSKQEKSKYTSPILKKNKTLAQKQHILNDLVKMLVN